MARRVRAPGGVNHPHSFPFAPSSGCRITRINLPGIGIGIGIGICALATLPGTKAWGCAICLPAVVAEKAGVLIC
jgi:hypothetical protein